MPQNATEPRDRRREEFPVEARIGVDRPGEQMQIDPTSGRPHRVSQLFGLARRNKTVRRSLRDRKRRQPTRARQVSERIRLGRLLGGRGPRRRPDSRSCNGRLPPAAAIDNPIHRRGTGFPAPPSRRPVTTRQQAWTDGDVAPLPSSGSSNTACAVLVAPTNTAKFAPADSPHMANRSGSMPKLDACARR